MCDPAGETFYGMGRMASGIEIPTPGEDWWQTKDVPHGEVRERRYFSKDHAKTGGAFLSIPRRTMMPMRPPVIRCSISSTVAARMSAAGRCQGHMADIMNNLIAEKKAQPMIIVMSSGYARKPGEAPNADASAWRWRAMPRI